MKILRIAAGLFLLITPAVQATLLNIGPPGLTFERREPFEMMNGVVFNGQTLSLNLELSDSITIFRRTKYFAVGFILDVTPFNELDFVQGSASVDGVPAYFFSAISNPNGEPFDGVLLFINPNNRGAEEKFATFQSIHLDLLLPDDGVEVKSGEVELFAQDLGKFNSAPFRIGPQVPDTGATLPLLGFALTALLMGSKLSSREGGAQQQ